LVSRLQPALSIFSCLGTRELALALAVRAANCSTRSVDPAKLVVELALALAVSPLANCPARSFDPAKLPWR